MHRRSVFLLAVALAAALGVAWFQHHRLRQAESMLGKYWSNDLAMVFSHLGAVSEDLRHIAASGEMGREAGARLDSLLSQMTVHLTNTLGDIRRYRSNVPQVPYLVGYLDQVRETVNMHRGLNTPRPLTAEERQLFQGYAHLSEELTAMVRQYYPDYPGDGAGFTSDDRYWAQGFLSDVRWRELLFRMDARAQAAGYLPR